MIWLSISSAIWSGRASSRWSARIFGEGLQYAGAAPGRERVEPSGQVLAACGCQGSVFREGREYVGFGASVVPAANRVDQVDLLMRAQVVPVRNLGQNAEPILAMPDLHRSIDEIARSAVGAVGMGHAQRAPGRSLISID